MPSPPPHRLWTAGFVLMWAGQFLISMNFYLLMTVMALYAMERFGTDEALAGVATSAFIVGAVLARLLTGKYMELLGRRRVLLAALVLLALCAAAYLLDTGFGGLLVVRSSTAWASAWPPPCCPRPSRPSSPRTGGARAPGTSCSPPPWPPRWVPWRD